ncbi:hypothetical protein [Streptomyces olivochromogenes]|uniref:hypothetical protein n=1 Tax=Streptomyces olivochromogenes TaxID=1963 RepID=UPI001F29197F|nr:hypothetical protein [Streptomyces olivochromogenes]MCF3131705.1 hypothetical protein [Streptomyces olivochromogenes]
MIKNVLRALPALALSVIPLAAPATATPGPLRPAGERPSAAALPASARKTLPPPSAADAPLYPALAWIEQAEEGSRDGYSREQFGHWNKGLNPTDGCNTRKDVILAKALEAPKIGPKCALAGGRWWSRYDQEWSPVGNASDGAGWRGS